MSLLARINTPSDIQKLSPHERVALCAELRTFIIDHVAKTGGHLASNLGVIELTVALLAVFEPPADKLVWDVGHQAYAYKILTGRRAQMGTLRQLGGLAPFPKITESRFDAFGTGHSSTAISAALGMALAEYRQQPQRHHIAIIGDGGLTAGMAFEALNRAGALQLPLLVIINDNQWSISENVGYIHQTNSVRQLAATCGFDYQFLEAGHDLTALYDALLPLKSIKKPFMLHIKTIKGKGYPPAEQNPLGFHGVGAFNPATGAPLTTPAAGFSSAMGEQLLQELKQDPNLWLISPAMLAGSGLNECQRQFPERVLDVGIAEQHALTLAAGLAAAGAKVVVAIYATFLQRALDQLIHDIALQNLPVVLLIDRAGLVGADGATHHGYFDIAELIALPNMALAVPADLPQAQQMLHLALQQNQLCALRYPRGGAACLSTAPVVWGRAQVVVQGQNVAILAFGTLLATLLPIAQKLGATLVDMRFAAPLDKAVLQDLSAHHALLVTVEEGSVIGGIGTELAAKLRTTDCAFGNIGLADGFYPHGSRTDLLALAGLDAVGLERQIRALMAAAGLI